MFSKRLATAISRTGNCCVIGLDPAAQHIPDEFFSRRGFRRGSCSLEELARIFEDFSMTVIDAVVDLVPVVKPQVAFFEELGAAGIAAMERVVAAARERGLIVLLDAKRGDVPNTAAAYARAYLAATPARGFECDAITVNPYLGLDGLDPFFEQANVGKGIFVCVKTSNPGSADVQELRVDGEPLYLAVARMLAPAISRSIDPSGYSNIGFVVGGQHPDAAMALRREFPHVWFLVPGVGAQGGSPKELAPFFGDQELGALVSSSRSVLYPHLFAGADRWSIDAVRTSAREFAEGVNRVRKGQ